MPPPPPAPPPPAPPPSGTPLIELRQASRVFVGRGGLTFRRAPSVPAVDGVSLALHAGETVALVGESGSGKSTLGRMMLGLTPPDAGQVLFRGEPLGSLRGEAWRRYRREAQAVFQDAGASLNPRRTAVQSVAVPLRHNLRLSRAAARARADELLEEVGLPPARFRDRLPHEMSGGQRQRVGIARAVASRPAFVVADEPVSALDVSIRAQILRLLLSLAQRDRLAILFITHDIGVVRAVADRVAVMYRGVLVEQGPAPALLARPRHPYTAALLAAVPVPDPAVPPRPLAARAPSGARPIGGCRFRDRCTRAAPACAADPPQVASPEGGVALLPLPAVSEYWQVFLPSAPPPAVWVDSYAAPMPDGTHLPCPLRDFGDWAVAGMIANQASFAVADRLSGWMADAARPFAPEVVCGLPTLGHVFGAGVARALGHANWVAPGTTRKLWYDPALSVPTASITARADGRRMWLDPRLLPRLRGRRVLLVDDVISTGSSALAGLALLRAAGVAPVALCVGMVQGRRWEAAWPGTVPVLGAFETPVFRRVEGGWAEWNT